MDKVKCDRCGRSPRGMIILSDSSGWERHLCRDCQNEEMAEALGIENYKDFIKTYQVKDVNGELHVFDIHKEILPLGIKWLANEIKNGEVEGYQFGLYAKLDDDPVKCFQKLYRNINKGLSKKYIKEEQLGGYTSHSLPEDQLIGRIAWDDEHDGEIPKIVIDGKTYSWYEIGKMLMTYEGWNLVIKVQDIGDEDS
ncbi:MAG: DUF7713 domain-containing protein [Eubacteriales bacterium]